jgi:hypothetical protein
VTRRCLRGPHRLHGPDGNFSILTRGMAGSGSKTLCRIGCDFELRLLTQNADTPNLLTRYMAAPAQKRQQPARIGIAIPPDIHAEPNAGGTARSLHRTFAARLSPFGLLFGDFFGRRQGRAQHPYQCRGEGFTGDLAIGQQALRKRLIIIRGFFRQNATRLFG